MSQVVEQAAPRDVGREVPDELDHGEVAAAGHPRNVLTPTVLGPVYGVTVRILPEPDCIQLSFSLPTKAGQDLRNHAQTPQMP